MLFFSVIGINSISTFHFISKIHQCAKVSQKPLPSPLPLISGFHISEVWKFFKILPFSFQLFSISPKIFRNYKLDIINQSTALRDPSATEARWLFMFTFIPLFPYTTYQARCQRGGKFRLPALLRQAILLYMVALKLKKMGPQCGRKL